ncbi:chemotaxis protein CheW [Pseudanabaena sp. PCC 6802]|uniref:chemotaxis protein CheW n=1 Tax=Pseudanabaena sp. PCC 6802 TaxID=118173 RepID=UPI00034B9967|nr:chemotaxis protein CheW [Pseudanabaena sp. PCC 6802]
MAESTSTKATASEQFLTFLLPPKQRVMISTKQLVEIVNISIGQVVPIPDVSPYVMGVSNWRGEVLWMVDLGCMLGFEPLHAASYTQATYKSILVRSQGQIMGLVVSGVEQMLWCAPDRIQTSVANYVTSDLASYLRGYYLAPDRDLTLVLDGDALAPAMNAIDA